MFCSYCKHALNEVPYISCGKVFCDHRCAEALGCQLRTSAMLLAWLIGWGMALHKNYNDRGCHEKEAHEEGA